MSEGHTSNPTALLDAAMFITADTDRDAVLILGTRALLHGARNDITAARVVSTAHGVYDMSIDGLVVSQDLFAPGWSAYEWRLQYQTYDVTALMRNSDDKAVRIEARVGNGWYRGDLGFARARANYGEEIGLLAALEILYRNGTHQVIPTSLEWTGRTGEIVQNSIYHGERIDHRLTSTSTPMLDIRLGEFDRSRLVPQIAAAVTRQDMLSPIRLWKSEDGYLVDFGQNLVGRVRIRVDGPEGTEIDVYHGEVLEGGRLGTRPLRHARAADTFVLGGGGTEVFEPSFTFHGFRYVEIIGWPGVLRPEQIEAVVIHSDLRPTSSFECSEPLINQLVHNSVWGQKGNFLSIPSDCPQRDERLGWTGDIAVYAATAAYQFDVADFLHSWLEDLAAETSAHGSVPLIVPNIFKDSLTSVRPSIVDRPAQAIWSDAAVWVPEALWWAYGEKDRLAAHYPVMVAHLESVEDRVSESGLWDADVQLADWLDPDAPPNDPGLAKADPGVVATAAFVRSATFTAEAAGELGLEEDASRWTAMADRSRSAFRQHYVDAASERIASDCATVYALAIAFGLLEQDETIWAARRLAELVAIAEYRVTTGFAGTPFVTWALSENGYSDVAYRLLLNRECPSWLYPVTMGATTVWERWDSLLPDGRINPGEMTSFNHYALGAVVGWIYQVVAGIRAAEPGYRRILIQPVPGEGISWVRATYDSCVGRILVDWRTDEELFELSVSLPAEVSTDVVLPDGARHTVTGGSHSFTARRKHSSPNLEGVVSNGL